MKKQWSADIPVTESLVRSLLAQQFPQLVPVQLQHYAAGWDNSLFLVNGTYIFRFPRRKVAADLIKMENRLLPALSARLPVPVPNPIYIGKPMDEYPYSFSGYVKLAGNVPYLLDLTDAQRAQSAVRLAEFLRSLHSIPPDLALQWRIAASDQLGRMDLNKRIPMYIAKVKETHDKGLVENPAALLLILNDLPTAERRRQRENRTVVHGDLNFRNFLVDRQGILSAVIDWGDAHLGHPAVDLSVVYSYLPTHARLEFFKVYGKVETEAETLGLARFRSLYTNLVILNYAHDIGDARQLMEAQRAIACTLQA